MNSTKNQINLEKYPDLCFELTKSNINAVPVYGPFERQYISDWGQSKIHHGIVQAFNKMNIKQMKPIQKNSFSYLMNNCNTAMVGFSKGKSLAYLTSIFSLIMNNTYNEKMEEIGPIAIVLTNSLGSCGTLERLSKQLDSFTRTENKVGVVIADASTSVHTVESDLCNGSKILIATPTYLNVLLKKSKLFSWLKLRHFVFDNIDLLLENYKDEFDGFVNILKKMKDKKDNIQFISTSVRWTKEMDAFLNFLFVKWQYIFGSSLEAAHYMKIGFNVVHVKNDKLQKISWCLKNNIKYGRSVLITSNSDELDTILSYFQSEDSDIEILLANQVKSAIIFTDQAWKSSLKKNQRLLICSDDMMLDHYISDADCLIHYDIPAEKYTFSIRFSVLQDSNLIFEKKKRSTYVFLSDSKKDMLQLPKIVDIMKTFGNGELDPILLKNVNIINETLEKEKVNSFFCHKIQQFGFCLNQSCKYRHILIKEIDAPADNIPKSGLAIIKILNFYNATHMSVKLLKLNHTNNLNDQNWVNVKDNSVLIKEKLSLFYSTRNNKIVFEKPKPGDIVAVELDVKFREEMSSEYFRATVIDFVNLSSINHQVKVKLIDEGHFEIVSNWKIFVLPDEYKSIQTTTVDMYMLSVKPVDFDYEWCDKADSMVKEKLKLAEKSRDTIIVKIKLALGTTIWVSKMHTKLRMHDFEAILPDILLNFGYGTTNTEHFDKLTELSTSANINLPLKEIVQKDYEMSKEEFRSLYKLPQPQWAHLDQNVNALVSVDFINSPKCFFVRNSKFNDCLSNLYVKINDFIEQNQVEELKNIVEGTFCLAKYPSNNQYSRVQIIKILNETLVEVLFVDIGDFFELENNSLLTIHPDLIITLPFQIIECSLHGTKDALPSGKELDNLVNFMFDLTEALLYSKVINITSSPIFTGGSHYEVILYDENINVNLKMHAEFNQYFDYGEISNQLDNLHLHDNRFDMNLCEVDLGPDDMIAFQAFLDNVGQAQFGQNYELLKENPEQIIEYFKGSSDQDMIVKEMNTEMISTTPVTQKEILVDHTIEPIEKTTETSVDLAEPKTVLTQKITKSKLNKKPQNLCSTCNNYAQSCVPKCIWYQDTNYIYLKFSILDTSNFSINCTPENIIFEAQSTDTSYNFCVELFGCIIDENVTHKTSYEGFHIKAEKLCKADYEWPRLFKCKKRHNYVSYDTNHIKPEDQTIWLMEMNKFKMNALETPLVQKDYEINDSSDCDSVNDLITDD